MRNALYVCINRFPHNFNLLILLNVVIELLFKRKIHYLCTCLRRTFNRTIMELKEKTTSVDRQFFGIVDSNAHKSKFLLS
nr:MAG TPA: hypothetical protein [Caudoviricetes sp.]